LLPVLLVSPPFGLVFLLDPVYPLFYNFSMNDEGKTKRQLIDELVALRRQIVKTKKYILELEPVKENLKQKENLFKFFVESSPIAMALMEGSPPQVKYICNIFYL
jgi:hypothetical protein